MANSQRELARNDGQRRHGSDCDGYVYVDVHDLVFRRQRTLDDNPAVLARPHDHRTFHLKNGTL
jgi:hypothetical protein